MGDILGVKKKFFKKKKAGCGHSNTQEFEAGEYRL